VGGEGAHKLPSFETAAEDSGLLRMRFFLRRKRVASP
jgi:hypothetical protein